MLKRFDLSNILRQLDAGVGGGGDTSTIEKPVADAAAGGDAAKAGAGDTGGADAAKDADAEAGDKGAADAAKGGDAFAGLGLTDELRAQLAGALPKDAQERGAKWLARRASLADLVKAGLSGESKISELTEQMKGAIKVPGKDAKPEEIAAYRKAVGVPEAADKYAVYRPEGYEPTDMDKTGEQMLLEAAHGANYNQAQVDAALKTYYAVQAHAAKEQAEKVAKASEAAVEDLRAEFGRDYKANVTLADRWLAENLGGDMGEDWKGLMGMRFADGRALGEHPGFVKAIVKLAKASADDGSLIMPTDMGAGQDVDAELNKMKSKMGTPEYNTKEFQDKMDRLIAIQLKRKATA